MKRQIFLILGIVLVGIVVLKFFTIKQIIGESSIPFSNIHKIEIGSTTVKLIGVAFREADRQKGLSGMDSLSVGSGLLFAFDKLGFYGIWMKDMNFPIDIIWIDGNTYEGNGVITGLKENATPESYPTSFNSEKPSIYVLETNIGLIAKENLKIGDPVKFTK